MMFNSLLIGLGGALGALTRHFSTELVRRTVGQSFPWGTVAVNAVGCFLAGALLAVWGGALPQTHWRFFLVSGFLGGFTTFSAFALDSLLLHRLGDPGSTLVYVALTLLGSLFGASAGFYLFSEPS